MYAVQASTVPAVFHGISGGIRVTMPHRGYRMRRVKDDLALGERSGLIKADHVDTGETLHRGKLLHQNVLG